MQKAGRQPPVPPACVGKYALENRHAGLTLIIPLLIVIIYLLSSINILGESARRHLPARPCAAAVQSSDGNTDAINVR
jgi:hypothetical protein